MYVVKIERETEPSYYHFGNHAGAEELYINAFLGGINVEMLEEVGSEVRPIDMWQIPV